MQSANAKPQTKQMTNDVRAIGAFTTYGRGIQKGNPKLCLKCRKPISAGEAWVKYTSASDPELGRYSVIVHSRCNGHKK